MNDGKCVSLRHSGQARVAGAIRNPVSLRAGRVDARFVLQRVESKQTIIFSLRHAAVLGTVAHSPGAMPSAPTLP
jgi:hypothetical protein